MDLDKNAPLTPPGREEPVRRLLIYTPIGGSQAD